jgi:hypothetical protein
MSILVRFHALVLMFFIIAGSVGSGVQVVHAAALTQQSITINGPLFLLPEVRTVGISATGGGSNNPIVFSVATVVLSAVQVCTVTQLTETTARVSIAHAGVCTVLANQAGDAIFDAAPQAQIQFTIAKKLLPYSVVVLDKVYDGTTTATLQFTDTDSTHTPKSVTFTATATFADSNVGTNKLVTPSTVTLGGADAGDYRIEETIPSELFAAITPASIAPIVSVTGIPLTVAVTVANKVHDGTTAATPALVLSGVQAGDTVTVSGTAAFADGNVGTGKQVSVTSITLGGADKDRYSLATTTATTTADIIAKPVTLTLTVSNKQYDGTTAATLATANLVAALAGVLTGDAGNVSVTSGTLTFVDSNVGTGKALTATGFALAGAAKDNYALTLAPILADITAAPAPAPVVSSGGGGGGGGGGYFGGTTTFGSTNITTTATTIQSAAAGSTVPVGATVQPTTNTLGTVLGVSTYKFTRTLKLKMKGADVKELQKILIAKKFLADDGNSTGYFGAATRAAVMAYQTAHNLEAVGYVGPATRTLLNKGI